MGVKSSIIEKIERDFKDKPTDKLFKEISNQKVTEFLQVLYRLDRHDVLNIFFENLCIKSGKLWRNFLQGTLLVCTSTTDRKYMT